MRISLPVRAALTIVFILSVAVAMTGILSLHQLRSFSNDFLRDKMVLVLDSVRDSMETSLVLGLPLDALPGVNRAIQATLERDPQILSVEFFDGGGNILYSSDETLLGDLVSEEWALEWDVGDNSYWTREERDAKVVGLRVRDALGVEVGSLALRYSRSAFDQRINEMAVRIGIVSIVVVLVFAALGAWLSYRLTGGIRDLLVVTRELVADGQSSSPRSAESEFDTPRSFAETVRAVHDSIEAASAEVRDIEEGAETRIAPVEASG